MRMVLGVGVASMAYIGWQWLRMIRQSWRDADRTIRAAMEDLDGQE